MILFILIIISSFIVQLFLPWWIIVPIVLFCCFVKASSSISAFMISFLSIFILWFVISLFLSFQNEHILANRIGQMLGLGIHSYNWLFIAVISAIPGAITAGFSGVSGFLLRKIISNN